MIVVERGHLLYKRKFDKLTFENNTTSVSSTQSHGRWPRLRPDLMWCELFTVPNELQEYCQWHQCSVLLHFMQKI